MTCVDVCNANLSRVNPSLFSVSMQAQFKGELQNQPYFSHPYLTLQGSNFGTMSQCHTRQGHLIMNRIRGGCKPDRWFNGSTLSEKQCTTKRMVDHPPKWPQLGVLIHHVSCLMTNTKLNVGFIFSWSHPMVSQLEAKAAEGIKASRAGTTRIKSRGRRR